MFLFQSSAPFSTGLQPSAVMTSFVTLSSRMRSLAIGTQLAWAKSLPRKVALSSGARARSGPSDWDGVFTILLKLVSSQRIYTICVPHSKTLSVHSQLLYPCRPIIVEGTNEPELTVYAISPYFSIKLYTLGCHAENKHKEL